MRAVRPKHDVRIALAMQFADHASDNAYDAHAEHVAFVETHWDQEISSFLEIDTTAI